VQPAYRAGVVRAGQSSRPTDAGIGSFSSSFTFERPADSASCRAYEQRAYEIATISSS